MCLVLLKVEQSAFTSFSSLSDVDEFSEGLQMASSSHDWQRANCDSPHNWLMSLAMYLATCVTCRGENGTN